MAINLFFIIIKVSLIHWSDFSSHFLAEMKILFNFFQLHFEKISNLENIAKIYEVFPLFF